MVEWNLNYVQHFSEANYQVTPVNMDPNKPLYTLFKDQPFPNDFQFSDTVFGQCKSVK